MQGSGSLTVGRSVASKASQRQSEGADLFNVCLKVCLKRGGMRRKRSSRRINGDNGMNFMSWHCSWAAFNFNVLIQLYHPNVSMTFLSTAAALGSLAHSNHCLFLLALFKLNDGENPSCVVIIWVKTWFSWLCSWFHYFSFILAAISVRDETETQADRRASIIKGSSSWLSTYLSHRSESSSSGSAKNYIIVCPLKGRSQGPCWGLQ